MEKFFDGLGTEIIIFALGLIFGGGAGGAIGYRIAIKSTNKVSRKTTDRSKVVNKGVKTRGGDYVGRDKNG
ncbi:MAG: hypothetical protein FWH55_13535 [Oscillospiraceae bacterium]|nr:hypothetical protein [Oscillospiraceae bacterium]